MFAKAQIMGRAGTDPEVQYFESGNVKASVNVAVSDKYSNKAGESVDRTHWFKCEAWGKTAEILANYVLKGDLVMFDGVMVQEVWNDKVTGQKRDKFVVKIERVYLMPNKRDGGDKNQVNSHETRSNPEVQDYVKPDQISQANPDKVPDDIPF